MASAAAQVLVHKQLRDLLLTQTQLTDSLNKRQMQTYQQDVVAKMEYDLLVKQLEEERRHHDDTKARLASESDKLQFALGEIQVLTKQLEQEKANFELSFGQLKNKTMKENVKSNQLKARVSAVEAEKQRQEDVLSLKDSKISELKQRLARQKDSHKQQVSELNVQLQQEAFIARTLKVKGGRRKTLTKPGK